MTSLRLRSGRMTRLMPARWAARNFSLMPPTGSTRPRSVISPVMATSLRTGFPVSKDAMATNIVTPAEGPSLGMAPAGMWTCRSTFSRKLSSRPSHLARERMNDSAACADSFITSPSWAVSVLRHVLGRPLDVRDARGGDALDLGGLVLRHQHRDGADDVGHLPLQVAHPGLARVAVDDLGHRRVLEHHLLLVQAVLLQLLGDQELPRDVHLLLARVARDLQHLEAVPQGGGDGIHHVRRGDEHDLRQVEGDLEEVVREAVVL